MSKSRRKTPITGITMAESDKSGKQIGKRKIRKHVNDQLNQLKNLDLKHVDIDSLDELIEIEKDDIRDNQNSYPKDGKQYYDKIIVSDQDYDNYMNFVVTPNAQRKSKFTTKEKYENLMRK